MTNTKKEEKTKDVFGFDFIKKKLDIMSGVLNNTEGIAKLINRKIDNLSPVINNTGTLASRILERTNETNDLLKELIEEEDFSDFYFSRVQIDNIIIEGRIEKITMNEFQQVSATYEATKKDGSPAKVENPRLETDHPELVVGTIDEAAQRVTIKPIKGAVKEDTAIAVKLIADSIPGEGEQDIEIVGSFMLTPGRAEKLALKFEEPVDLEE